VHLEGKLVEFHLVDFLVSVDLHLKSESLTEGITISRSTESQGNLVYLSIFLCIFKGLNRDLKFERVLCGDIKVNRHVHELNGHEGNFFTTFNGVGHT
jgi:hypothetical protein